MGSTWEVHGKSASEQLGILYMGLSIPANLLSISISIPLSSNCIVVRQAVCACALVYLNELVLSVSIYNYVI